MNLLLKLPDDIIVSILSSWIELKEVNRLETSIGSKKERKSVLDLLCSDLFSFEHDVKLNPSKMKWMVLRNIKLESMTLSKLKKLFVNGNLPIATSKLRSLSIRDHIFYSNKFYSDLNFDANIIEIVSQSPQLCEFNVSCYADNMTINIFTHFKSIFFENLKVLRILLHDKAEYDHLALARIATDCHKLITCKFYHEIYNYDDTTIDDYDEIWLKLIRNNPNLTVLHVSNVRNAEQMIDEVGFRCSGLKHLGISSCEKWDFPMQSIVNFLERCRNLSKINMSSNIGYIYFYLVNGNSKRCFKLALYSSPDENFLQDVTKFIQKNKFHSLEFLDDSWEVTAALSESFYKSVLEKQPQLENLYVRQLGGSWGTISFQAMTEILKNKPNLTGILAYFACMLCSVSLLLSSRNIGLTLCRFSLLTDNEMLILLTECECPLKSLSIDEHDTLTATTFNEILKKHSQLTFYKLRGCDKIDKKFKFVRDSRKPNPAVMFKKYLCYLL